MYEDGYKKKPELMRMKSQIMETPLKRVTSVKKGAKEEEEVRRCSERINA